MWETFLHSVVSVLLILMLTAVGYYVSARGWVTPEVKHFLSRFIMRIVVPFYCVYGLLSKLDRDLLFASGPFLLCIFLNIVCLFLLAALVGKLLKLPRKKLGVFLMMCALSNAMFIGYPMCMELFGEECIPYVLLYYVVTTSFTQLVGLNLIRWSGESGRLSGKMFLRFLTTPAVLALILGIVLVLLDVKLPAIVMSFAGYMSDLVTPLALLLTGIIIREIGLRELKPDLPLLIALLFRCAVAAGTGILFCRLLGVEGLGRSVLLIEASMPVVSQTAVAASEYGADEGFAARGAALTTVACFVYIPVLMLLIGA